MVGARRETEQEGVCNMGPGKGRRTSLRSSTQLMPPPPRAKEPNTLPGGGRAMVYGPPGLPMASYPLRVLPLRIVVVLAMR